jgi:hypothetical protein
MPFRNIAPATANAANNTNTVPNTFLLFLITSTSVCQGLVLNGGLRDDHNNIYIRSISFFDPPDQRGQRNHANLLFNYYALNGGEFAQKNGKKLKKIDASTAGRLSGQLLRLKGHLKRSLRFTIRGV